MRLAWSEMCPPKLEKNPSFGVIRFGDAPSADSLLFGE